MDTNEKKPSSMRLASALILIFTSFSMCRESQFGYDWILSVGGYKFSDELGQKNYGIEASFLPLPYFGVVTSYDFDYTKNIGIELIGNVLVFDLLPNLGPSVEKWTQGLWPLIFIPGLELGASFDREDEIGVHTSIFFNFIIFQPYWDYNYYQGYTDKKIGFKWKFGLGPWMVRAITQG